MKTSSAWGEPPTRYYAFLERLAKTRCKAFQFDVGVLGCADGKFVLPAARAGLHVLAVDRDETALFGGLKPWVGGETRIDGLCGRLAREGLSNRVAVLNDDFISLAPRTCRGVWVSGAIQYSCNIKYTAAEVVARIQEFVAVGGLLYIDYMLPFEEKYKGRPNCPEAAWWGKWSREQVGWTVFYNRVLAPTRDLPHIEYPVDHYHQWGHILMRRGQCPGSA